MPTKSCIWAAQDSGWKINETEIIKKQNKNLIIIFSSI